MRLPGSECDDAEQCSRRIKFSTSDVVLEVSVKLK
jgi:hypothetical protein